MRFFEQLEQRLIPSISNPFLNFKGDSQVVRADLNNDKAEEIIYAAGRGGGPNVQVFDGQTENLISSFYAFSPSFSGGVNLTVINGEIICGAGPGGGPQISIFDVFGTIRTAFYAFPADFRGGVVVNTTDINGDGLKDILSGAGPGGLPQVTAFDINGNIITSFYSRGYDNFGVSAEELNSLALKLNIPTFQVGYNVFNYNVTDIPLYNFGVAQQNKIPKHLLDVLVANGNRLVFMVGNGVTDYPAYSFLKGQHLYNDKNLPLWDTTIGIGGLGKNSDVVVLLNKYYETHSQNLILHEQAHAIDSALGGLSSTNEWVEIWKTVDWSYNYYTTYKNEAWAEGFARYFHSETTRQSLPNSVALYFAKLG